MSQSTRRYHTESGDSQESRSTAPTSLYSSPNPSIHSADYKQQYNLSPATTYCPRSSTETYSSSLESLELCEEPDTYNPEYQVPEYREVVEDSDVRPSNPSDFADYFPTSKRVYICHDDTTHDGNMNLRVDAEGRRREAVQLFHLKMNDLNKREFSFRRYERASGREVCHSSWKTKPATEKRPALGRSMSNAFNSIKRPEFKRTNSGLSTHSHKSSQTHKSKKDMRRQDSGYASDDVFDEDFEQYLAKKSNPTQHTSTMRLEFSNYAQVDVKRRGAKSSKRYEFEYWGYNYAWKRVCKKDGYGEEISYHLYKGDNPTAVAHIVPEMRSPSQMREEERNGGWVPPCSLWISDKSVLEALTDVADVIVATGLMALVDDCIKRHFGSRHSSHSTTHQVNVPLTPLKYDVEFVGPRAMYEAMFKRRNSAASGKERGELRSSPLRGNAVTVY